RGYLRQLFRNQSGVLKALRDGDIDFAYLWANATWTVHDSPDLAAKLEIMARFEPEDRWQIAVAMRQGDDELKHQVDAALQTLIADGTVARILARYHVPSDVATGAPAAKIGAGDVIRHGVANRGREPLMQKIQ